MLRHCQVQQENCQNYDIQDNNNVQSSSDSPPPWGYWPEEDQSPDPEGIDEVLVIKATRDDRDIDNLIVTLDDPSYRTNNASTDKQSLSPSIKRKDSLDQFPSSQDKQPRESTFPHACFNCGKIGHSFRHCSEPLTGEFCKKCGLRGTTKANCKQCHPTKIQDQVVSESLKKRRRGRRSETSRIASMQRLAEKHEQRWAEEKQATELQSKEAGKNEEKSSVLSRISDVPSRKLCVPRTVPLDQIREEVRRRADQIIIRKQMELMVHERRCEEERLREQERIREQERLEELALERERQNERLREQERQEELARERERLREQEELARERELHHERLRERERQEERLRERERQEKWTREQEREDELLRERAWQVEWARSRERHEDWSRNREHHEDWVRDRSREREEEEEEIHFDQRRQESWTRDRSRRRERSRSQDDQEDIYFERRREDDWLRDRDRLRERSRERDDQDDIHFDRRHQEDWTRDRERLRERSRDRDDHDSIHFDQRQQEEEEERLEQERQAAEQARIKSECERLAREFEQREREKEQRRCQEQLPNVMPIDTGGFWYQEVLPPNFQPPGPVPIMLQQMLPNCRPPESIIPGMPMPGNLGIGAAPLPPEVLAGAYREVRMMLDLLPTLQPHERDQMFKQAMAAMDGILARMNKEWPL